MCKRNVLARASTIALLGCASLLAMAGSGRAGDLQITGLHDLQTRALPGRPGTITLTDEVCVRASGSYVVSIDSDNGRLMLNGDTPGSGIGFAVAWGTQPGPGGGHDVPGALGTFQPSGADCEDGGHRAVLTIEIPKAALAAVPAGQYQATLKVELSQP